MQTIFWGLIIFGILYALISLLFSDVIESTIEAMLGDVDLPFLNPTVLVSGLTALGAVGVLLLRYTSLSAIWIILLALAGAIFISVIVFFLYIKPMKNRENSLSYSIKDLVGSIGTVSISIPAKGYGEVLVKIGFGNSNHIAASWDHVDIPQDTRVVIVEVREDTLLVSRLETEILP